MMYSVELKNLHTEARIIFDLPISEDDLTEKFKAIKLSYNYAKENEDYEFNILEFMRFFGVIACDLMTLNQFAEHIEALKDYEQEEINAIAESSGALIEDVIEIHKSKNFEYFMGQTFIEFAKNLIENGYLNIKEDFRPYINYEKVIEELKTEQNYKEVSNGIIRIIEKESENNGLFKEAIRNYTASYKDKFLTSSKNR